MLVSTVLRPKSLLRSCTSDVCSIFCRSGSGSEPVGLRTIPKRAGSPAAGSTLYSDPLTVSGTGRRPSRCAVTPVVTVPTWLALGQESLCSRSREQRGVAVGFPTNPGGKATVRSLTWAPASVKPMWMSTLLCAPALGFAGAAERLCKPRAAWAAGAIARHATRTKAHDIHVRRTTSMGPPSPLLVPPGAVRTIYTVLYGAADSRLLVPAAPPLGTLGGRVPGMAGPAALIGGGWRSIRTAAGTGHRSGGSTR